MGWREKQQVKVNVLGDEWIVRRIEMSDLGTIDGLDMALAARLFVDNKQKSADAERLAAEMPQEIVKQEAEQFVESLSKQKDMHDFFAQFARATLIYPDVAEWPSDDTITAQEVGQLPTSVLVAIFNTSTGVGQTAPFRNGAGEAN